jgi:hypothetical protein
LFGLGSAVWDLLGSDVWVLLLSMVIFHCLLPGLHWSVGSGLHCFHLSMLSHTLRILDILRMGKFLIRFSVPSEAFSTWRERRVWTPMLWPFFNNFPCFQKSGISMSHDLVDFLLFLNYWALFAVSFVITITVKAFFNTRSFMLCFSTWEALLFLCTKLTYMPKFPTFVTLSYSCNKSRNFNLHIAKIYR